MADSVSDSEFLVKFRISKYVLVPDSEDRITDSVVPDCPVLVFINSRSGGQLGGDLLVTYRSLLNQNQVRVELATVRYRMLLP